MLNEPKVIELAVKAVNANAHEVRDALGQYITAKDTTDLAFARDALRRALMAQAYGFELSAHDGATHRERVEAAKAALRAWDNEQ